MDFRNEALNMLSMKAKLEEFRHSDTLKDNLIIPSPLMDLTSRRVMTMEWVTGAKLTQLPAQEIRDLVKVGQEAFLVQLLEIGALLVKMFSLCIPRKIDLVRSFFSLSVRWPGGFPGSENGALFQFVFQYFSYGPPKN